MFTSNVTLSSIDEALFHLALANLPAELRQERIDALLDMRLERMNARPNMILVGEAGPDFPLPSA